MKAFEGGLGWNHSTESFMLGGDPCTFICAPHTKEMIVCDLAGEKRQEEMVTVHLSCVPLDNQSWFGLMTW